MDKECGFTGCGRKVEAKGLCVAHYMQQRRGLELRPIRPSRPKAEAGMNWCGACKQMMPESRFGWDTTRDQIKRVCKDCMADREMRYRLHNKEKYNKYMRARKYGLTVEEWDRLYESQNGRCALCGNGRTDFHELCIDHDHETGEIRAMLCQPCNGGIGLLQDNPELLDKAAAYLRHHASKRGD